MKRNWKRILTVMCALTLVMAASIPALAAEPKQCASHYPIEVEEYMEGDNPRIRKVYQLSLADDPSELPTEDFERDGRLYYLLDMTRSDEVGVDIKTYTQTETLASDTNKMEDVLKRLEPQMEVTTEDGYTGILTLDHTTVKVDTDGYATHTQDLSASRTYPNLSEADISLIPKTIEEKGKTLSLADVKWTSTKEDGPEGPVERFTAAAQYTGTAKSTYATGYTITADYTGQVSKTNCSVLTYTAIFGSMEIPEEKEEPAEEPPKAVMKEHEEKEESKEESKEEKSEEPAHKNLTVPLVIGGAVLVAGVGGALILKKRKERR